MQRLAFIRLLAQQGMEQSRLPDPLAASCILTFHDAVELFLVLASEHLSITIPDRGQFIARYFETMHPDKAGPVGVDLDGKIGIKRLTVQRNSFKHDAALPAGRTIEQARVDTKQFFEGNTPKVFGLPFDGIDMAEVIPQAQVRDQLHAAAAAWRQGDHAQGMGLLRIAFEELFEGLIHDEQSRGSTFTFGRRVQEDPFLGGKVAKALTLDARGKYAPVPSHLADSVGKHIQYLTETVSRMQEALRATSLGIDYHRFYRFRQLTPDVTHFADGRREARPRGPYSPCDEDFEYCQQFVVSAALRLAEMEEHLTPPAWRV